MIDNDEDDFGRLHAREDDIDTSKMAARLAEPNAVRHKHKIYEALEKHGPMTSEEIAKKTGLSLWQCGRRVPDLRAEYLVIDTGMRRKNSSGRDAAVWGIRDAQDELQFDPVEPQPKSRKKLAAENERLREALVKIRDIYNSAGCSFTEAAMMYQTAKEALEDE